MFLIGAVVNWRTLALTGKLVCAVAEPEIFVVGLVIIQN